MDRRRFIKAIGLATALAASGPRAGAAPPPNLQGRRPNIVFILADDLGYGDLGCYGQQTIKTPNIDRLAAEGLRFTQAYAGGPVCTPSRSVLMTGLHNGHTPARDNIPHYHTYLEEGDVTVAEVLKNAGYRCGGVGKWSLGDAGTVGRATNQGFDMWFGYLNQDHAHYYYTEYLDDNEGRLELRGNTESREHYSHDLIAGRALDFIKDNKDQPFFLYAAFTLPHFSAPDEDPDGLTVPSTAPYADKPWSEKAKKYGAMIDKLDRDVGRIVALIEELGLTDNTLIVFTSDNGGHHETPEHLETSGPLTGFKRDLFEGGIRVPFIARWPGVVPAGATSREIVAFWDMMPTFAALAGTEAPPNLDGTSLVDALTGGPIADPHEYFYWDYGHCRDRYDQAVRIGNWKGIRLGRDADVQLYNLETDIGEEHDVAAQHPEIVARIEEIMKTAVTPSPRYPVGKKYEGKAIWQKPLG
jgi:arylsulfatase A-like enzyme